MATFTVRPEGIIRQPALTMPGNATGSEAACTSLTASQIRTLLSLGTTSDVTFDIVRATTSVLSPLFNNPAAAATTLGNSTYGVTVPGQIYAVASGATIPIIAGHSIGSLLAVGYTSATLPYIYNSGNGLYLGSRGQFQFAIGADVGGANHRVSLSSSAKLGWSNTSYADDSAVGAHFVRNSSTSIGVKSATGDADLTAGAATFSGDISMSKTSAQGYIYAYSTGGVRNTRCYHDNSNGWMESSYGDLVLNSGDGDVYAFKSGTNSTLGVYNSDGSRSVLLNPTTVPAVVGSTNLYAIATNGAVVLQGSAGSVQVFKSGSNCTVDVYDSGVTKYSRVTHDGTNGILSTSSGNLNLVPAGGTVAVTGGITASGVVSHGAYTVATLPAAGSNAGKMAQVTDSNVAASGNYGATVAAGGSNRVKVFSDGTNWVIA